MEYPILDGLKAPAVIREMSYETLEELAHETRSIIIDAVSKNGGHLASSLGVVELTIALLRLCDPQSDRIIWDVSHQSYPFKVLTGRYCNFHTLRTFGGLSGFSKPSENQCDAFIAGHASTSISAGLGIACADAVTGRKRKVVSIIGDGAMTGGMAFEGLNNLGAAGVPMVVVLNDNEMSISPNVGAISQTLSRILTGERSHSMRMGVRTFLKSIPSEPLQRLARKFEESAISFFTPGVLFEEMGLRYIGPIDGHKIKDMEKAFNTAFAHKGPVLVHISTVKGKGYSPAEEHPENYHSVSSFDIETGQPKKFGTKKTWTEAFGEKLTELAGKDDKIVAITAAMTDGTGLTDFAAKYPNRFYDTGIAEEHSVTFAAGLAAGGVKPYFAVYSTFLQRGFDQMIHDVALQDLPVRFCVDRAGLVGQDGPTHHGVFDISYLRLIPSMSIFLPKDISELNQMMDISTEYPHPLAIRYARGTADVVGGLPETPVKVGEPEIIYTGGEYAVISAGHIFNEAWRLWDMLEKSGHKTTLINLRFVWPLNMESIFSNLKGKKTVFTFEENVRAGGVGEMLALLIKERYPDITVHIMSLPDKFITHGSVDELRKLCGLTAEAAWAKAFPTDA